MFVYVCICPNLMHYSAVFTWDPVCSVMEINVKFKWSTVYTTPYRILNKKIPKFPHLFFFFFFFYLLQYANFVVLFNSQIKNLWQHLRRGQMLTHSAKLPKSSPHIPQPALPIRSMGCSYADGHRT